MKTLILVGRPNVGKSTLFNRLTRGGHALVHDLPGVTRDRREGQGTLGEMAFTVVDTAGLVDGAAADELSQRMTAQSVAALEGADVIALVVDGRAGILPDDRHFAAIARRSNKPVVLVVNKCEGSTGDTTTEAYRLGLGEPVAVSAAHGEGMADLYEALAPHLSGNEPEEEERENAPMQLAIVGRPNAGKSTLFNALLGEERVLTSPEPGTTRDSIAVETVIDGIPLKLIDTAGMRRKSHVVGTLEKMAVDDALRAVRYAHVVVLLLDATAPMEKQDATIASLAVREGRALVIGLNKADLVSDKDALLRSVQERLEIVLPQVRGVPLVMLSAIRGKNVHALIQAAQTQYGLWQTRVPTAELNRWLRTALDQHAPPLVEGRTLKLRYVTQVKARPPTFALFAARAAQIPEHYLRYLTNSLREAFHLPGIPLRLLLRTPKNPYTDKG